LLIQYASDLYLEFPRNKSWLQNNPLIPFGEILVLAGDIIPFHLIDDHTDFFNYVSDHFKTTYWVPGNHEYYHFDLANKCGKLHEAIRSNIFIVNNTSVTEENIRMILSTMWSHISIVNRLGVEQGMNDFKLLRYNGHYFNADVFNRLHEGSMIFLYEALNTPAGETTIVVTHHVHTFMNYPPMYKGDALNDAFAIELFDFIESAGPDYWIYGHHHFNQPDFKTGRTQLLTNQLGYVQNNEHAMFDSKRCIVSGES